MMKWMGLTVAAVAEMVLAHDAPRLGTGAGAEDETAPTTSVERADVVASEVTER